MGDRHRGHLPRAVGKVQERQQCGSDAGNLPHVGSETCIFSHLFLFHILSVYQIIPRQTNTYTETPKTQESQRYIKIPPETVDLLLQYAADQKRAKACVGDRWEETDYVFTGEYGRPIHPDSVNG